MIQRSETYLTDGRPSRSMIEGVIREFERDYKPLIDRNIAYYQGKHEILKLQAKRGEKQISRLVHPYPRYLSTIASGYLLGQPVTYKDSSNVEGIEELNAAYKKAGAYEEDSELARDASVTGKGVELIYTDENGDIKLSSLDPSTAFIVYDNTVQHKKIFGVHYYNITDEAGTKTGTKVNVITKSEILEYNASNNMDIPATAAAETVHYFSDVPMIEFWNDENEAGDFDSVISIIDAYNSLESERVNDKNRYADSLLIIKGCTIEPDYNEDGSVRRTIAQKIYEDRIIQLPGDNGESDIDYLSRTMDESQAELLRRALADDIHKLSMVPDMSDERFAGNTSGVAMRYKLLGFEQLIRIKERWFKQALRERLEIFCDMLRLKGIQVPEAEDIQITMSRALPSNELEIAQMISTLSGEVSRRTLISLLPFVDNADDEIEALEQQQEDTDERRLRAFGEPGAIERQQQEAEETETA